MKITDGEKLILMMLSELYDKLEVDGEIEPKFVQSAIFSNNLWGIPWKYPGIPFEEQDIPGIVKEVLDILDMWSFIEYRYDNLSEADKDYLEKELKFFGKNPKFPGFDGNNETEYMSTARFIVNDLNRFDEFKGRDFNSHLPSISAYRRMLSSFQEIQEKLSHDHFAVKDLVYILKAWQKPAHSRF